MIKYLSPAEIEQKKADLESRGVNDALIKTAIDEEMMKAERGRKAEAVCDTIRTAFAGVVLGNGIGLTEASDGWDAGAADEILAALRENDEQLDWRKISYADLNLHHCSVCFFDAEGMRFHLPAFLIMDLQGESYNDIDVSLTNKDEFCIDKFSLLNEVQRAAVRDFLRFIATDEEHSGDWDGGITAALEGHWKENPTV